MSAYLIFDLEIHDPEGFQEYRNRVPPLIARHGGEYLARSGECEVIEGSWRPRRFVLFRFPDRRAIRAFLEDPAYVELSAVRQRTCDSNVVAVDGLD